MSRESDFEPIRRFLRPGEAPRRRVRFVEVNKARGDFVLTSERILFIQKNLLGSAVEEIPFDRIDSVSHRIGLLFGAIQLMRTNGRVASFDQFNKKDIPELVDEIRGAIAASRAGNGDVGELIRQLKSLHDDGVLSSDEFERAKQRYLGQGPDDRQAMVRTLSSLSELRKSGVLTQVEFDIKKRDVLATTR